MKNFPVMCNYITIYLISLKNFNCLREYFNIIILMYLKYAI